MNRRFILFALIFCIIIVVFAGVRNSDSPLKKILESEKLDEMKGEVSKEPHSLSIESLRLGDYPGSDLIVEQTLTPGSNYERYIVSYKSEGLKIYALLTIPNSPMPAGGYPAIVFNHGFIPPAEYRTTERYIAYTDAFSKNGYILLRPDYRGHGESEGVSRGGYSSNDYTIDVLNALSSLEKLKDPSPGSGRFVDTNRIGMWGHSMGGFITLRSMVVRDDIRAGVVWGGVVASYPDLLNNWRRGNNVTSTPAPSGPRRWRDALRQEFGTPEENPEFWNSISANSYLKDISGPLQIHHATGDESVPVEFSRKLYDQMQKENLAVEYFEYQGDDHDITGNFNSAMNKSVEFFDRYLK